MSHDVRRRKYWIVPVCVLVAGIVFLCGYQQINAQVLPVAPAPGVPGAPGVPAAAPTAEPTMAMSAVMPAGAQTVNIKNWDGNVTSFVRFKYKTMDNRIITVHLPAMYRTQQMTRAGWDTLFQCYSMDVEAEIAAKEARTSAIPTEAVAKILDQLQKESDNAEGSNNPASAAMDFAQQSLPGIGSAGSVSLPPLFPGVF